MAVHGSSLLADATSYVPSCRRPVIGSRINVDAPGTACSKGQISDMSCPDLLGGELLAHALLMLVLLKQAFLVLWRSAPVPDLL